MPDRKSSLPWKAAICVLSFAMSCGVVAAQTPAPPPAVTVTPVVSRQVTETGDYIGRVTAIDKVDIVARVPGFIEERTFTEGQMVKKGDLLFRIEQATYKAAVEQARANLAKAKATEVNAKLQLERGKELVRNNNIPQATLDQRAADEAAAAAGVMEAQAQLDQAEINLGYTEIRSPIDGRIGLATFTVGNLVQPSSGRLTTLSLSSESASDLCHLSGQPTQYSRVPAQSGAIRQQHACDHSHQDARRQYLSASWSQQFPRCPGRHHDRHRGGTGSSAQSGRCSDCRRSRRRHPGTWCAAIGADDSAICRPARSSRPLCPLGRRGQEG